MVLGFVPCSIAYATPVVRKAFSLSTPRFSEADKLSSEQPSGRGTVVKFTVTCWHDLRHAQKR
jgi:hypothetical protein